VNIRQLNYASVSAEIRVTSERELPLAVSFRRGIQNGTAENGRQNSRL
jgi:hypothetical protein